MKILKWQDSEQQEVAQELKKLINNSVAELMQMRRLFTFIISLTFSLIAFADMSSRGKSSDLPGYGHEKYEFFILLLILVALGGAFLYFWSKEFLTKHKDFVKSIIVTLLELAAAGLFIWAIAPECADLIKSFFPESQSQASDARKDLPEGFVSRTNSKSDSWASYPPVTKGNPEAHTKPHDFMVAAINNPSFNLYDYYVVAGMTPQDTQFLTFDLYCRSQFIRDRYTPQQFREAYDKVSRAWPIFQALQYTDFSDHEIEKYMLEYDPFDTLKPRIEDASNPDLIRKLKITPLSYNGG